MHLIYAVGCNKIDDSLLGMVNASTFSQAPGTETLILCNNNSDRKNSEIIYSTCRDDGRWEPDPSSGLCPEFQGIYSYNYAPINDNPHPPPPGWVGE